MASDKKIAQKPVRPKARLPRGFRDRFGPEIAAERRLIEIIRGVYESYGFEPLQTPTFEYTDALGKFLPDVDRPNEGVFSLKDDDEQWMSLRYDLTAPLARYVAENFQNLPKPFRRYQTGLVYRNEKPGPGRFREFTQFDADTVGSNSPAADAELLMMVCDALEALGLKRGEYIVKINSRGILDGVLDAVGLPVEERERRGIVMRAIDKLDRLGVSGVRALLGEGRKDESGDYTKGANLSEDAAAKILRFLEIGAVGDDFQTVLRDIVGDNAKAAAAVDQLASIVTLCRENGYSAEQIAPDTSIIRGLDYYTGPVFEAQLTFPVTNEQGETVVFGSVAGGGRYDDLVARFTGQQVPATGISIGVSRLLAALTARGLTADVAPLVIVLGMGDTVSSFRIAKELRAAGVRAEAYVGTKKIPDQLKYADKRGAALVVMEGDDERAAGNVTIKDLKLGAELAKQVESRAEYLGARNAQVTIARADLVSEVKKILEQN
ncbi:histidine--tRNA ligase [Rhizomicrobium electricum]|uniref:Histidine--tRNA ligase n=1 Tax=Rhizomicrobium electricum TaxID=480070 RepID=A0ABN1EC61_9PROT|nr:histidine--tRNA ligase [Rhizomicrobium electricum]NIJ48074.1 histidyl-tRNA synthetase [Rhizomicrobium electricum]